MKQTAIAMLFTNTVTYEAAREVVAANGWNYPVYFSELKDTLALANTLIERGVKVIISRGGAATLLQRSVNIPIVHTKYSYYDFASSLEEAARHTDKVAFVAFAPAIAAAERAERYLLLGVTLVRIENPENLVATLEKLKESGIEVVIGGYSVTSAAAKCGLKSVSMKIQPHSITEAVEEAEHILSVFYDKEKQLQVVSSILNYTTNGIVVLDQNGIITNINQSARHILKIRGVDDIGRNYTEFFPHFRMITEALKGESFYRILVEHESEYIVVSCVPIKVGASMAGAVVNIQGSQEIQMLEGRIRKKAMSTGHVAKGTFPGIIGDSPELEEVKQKGRIYAAVDSTVLICGETGTGKELFAQSIHNASPRRYQPFVAVNCAAFPQDLLASELFGYVKGAFTGAKAEGKPGIFEMAHNGTIFLDEISGMPLELQAHLLRVIQEREVVRLGGEKVTPVDVRILAATNKDLLREIERGNFREDLYYRLCVLVLEIPPLRARVRDVRPLTAQFVKEYAVRYDRAVRAITDDAFRVLETMHFPGNIRELSATIERAVILCRKDTIDAEELERVLFGMRGRQPADAPAPDAALPAHNAFERAELQILRDTLTEHRGNRARAAAALGIGRTTLWRKMTQYGIT